MHCLRTFRGEQSASNSSEMISSMESASSSVEPELILHPNGSMHSDETYHLHRDDSMFTHNNVQSSQEGSLNDT